MKKFEFLIGSWDLAYRIPKSKYSDAANGTGFGTFKRALDDKYVYFDYSASIAGKNGQAHGIFAWDEKTKSFKYWWFESSGKSMMATCHFINEKTLLLNWHDTLLIQTFTKINLDKIILKMESPNSEGIYDLILEVTFTRKL